ncbi:QueT transporter family protein [Agrilactobacillus yilanensis]|uniref:QueT transporter family protein n=1 Tax=Agrilactobacillus yilanensis TaxID=2485997 RepID=A0ABW4J494_9LACO|nr:QueT transporter family protein [Agrilactobacillus yilanensis]
MTENTSHKTVAITKIGLVAALYVAVTLVVAPFSYGAVQLRLAEAFNHLAVFNKRNVVALTIGCAIANLASPLGIVDVVFGSLGTLVMTLISYYATRRIKSVPLKLTVSTIICTVMMFNVALELHIFNKLPFWPTYATVAIGELLSMALGAIIIYLVQKRINLTN